MLYEGIITPLLKVYQLYDHLTCPRHVRRSWKRNVEPEHRAIYGGQVKSSTQDLIDDQNYHDYLLHYFSAIDLALTEYLLSLRAKRLAIRERICIHGEDFINQNPAGMHALFCTRARMEQAEATAKADLERYDVRYACHVDAPRGQLRLQVGNICEDFKRNRKQAVLDDEAIEEVRSSSSNAAPRS